MTVVTKLSLIQLVFALFFACVMSVFFSSLHGISAIIGGGICVISNLFFAGKLFVGRHTTEPQKILRQFYRSEALKIAFVCAMFILVYKFVDIEFMPFIIAYALTALLNLVCLPFLK